MCVHLNYLLGKLVLAEGFFAPENTDTCTQKKMSLSKNMKDLDVTKLTAHKLM